MTLDEQASLTRAAQWREAFDQSFIRAPVDAATELHDYLAIRAGDTGYALRLAEIGGLQLLTGLTPCPSRRAELLGLSTFRGNVLPVYDLRVLLGVGVGSGDQQGAGLVGGGEGRAAGPGLRRLPAPPAPAHEASTRASVADARLYTGETLRSEGQLRPIVSIEAILLSITHMVQQDGN